MTPASASPTRVLGVHDGHNASAVLLVDGVVTSAVQEERLSRIKNHTGFPFAAVRHVLETAGLKPEQLDAIALSSLHYPVARTREEMLERYLQSSTVKAAAIEFLKRTPAKAVHRRWRRASRLEAVEQAGLDTRKVHFVEHHRCHAAAAYWGGPWRGEPVLVMTADGSGDDLSATVSIARPDGTMERVAWVAESDSLGGLYAMVTFALGLVPNDHEYKLMGLAPYAPATGAARVYEELRRLFEFRSDGLAWTRTPGVPHIYHALHHVMRLTTFQRFDCVAAGVQRLVEEMLTKWVSSAIRETGVRKVALGGGVFMNVKANKLILELDSVEGLFVFPSCGDETNPVGAAFEVYADLRRDAGRPVDIPPLGPIYWGRAFTEDQVERAVGAFAADHRVKVATPQNVNREVARLLAAGEVVARCSGPMEFGARALGNRSILANPGDWRVIKVINEMIKQRDFWMPFAPSMLAERAGDYTVKAKEVPAPYMILSFDTAPGVADKIIAAVHPYDGTARPHEVNQGWNAAYHELISEFDALTGKAVVLNTSFNLHGYPIVYSPADALGVLADSGLKHLALGGHLVSKV